MDLASMLKREDFFSSFFSSVEQYYAEALGERVSFSFATGTRKCNMVIKPHLSAASAVHISSQARSFYYSEWNIRNSLIKNIMAKTYVALATRTGSFFAQFRFSMQPEPDNLCDLIIAPNNRSIRIFDYGNDVVGCIIKNGFTEKFFQNQLKFRQQYHYDFILPLLAVGEKWFQEPILHGHPLARITDNNLYERSMKKAEEDLAILADDTLLFVPAEEYLSALENRIQQLLVKAAKEKNIHTAAQTAIIAADALERCNSFKLSIPTVMSHGDFQSGNIWVDDTGKVWLYDWETAERRSIWYDVSVLNYSLRRFNGWDNLMHTEAPVKMQLCHFNQQSEWQYEAMKAVVLLEDLVFYLEDMLELPYKWGAGLYDAFIQRLMKIEELYHEE